ncbi:S8 family serine peptidase [Algoriphagus sp. A40]|uniref:S8 family serine peptidase n=1 Tax=Algoriphagus sp. A40 TaxID=1945863 RepID=UPI000985EF94|nr:S8 family serine peptidase [Algoriphagus sp. A40]OOG72371.1 peptidase [Algoriphagus sp. A40]
MGGIKFCLGFLVFLVAGFTVQAQDRYAVYFKYKPQSALTLSKPQEFLTQKAIDRRTREGIQADSLDLPVSAKYLEQVAPISKYVLYSSKWMNAAVLVTDQKGAEQMEALPFVQKVELVAHDFLAMPNARMRYKVFASVTLATNCNEPKLNTRELAISANSYDFQNQLIGIDKMHEEGYTGDGVTVAVFDAGFPGTNTASALSHLVSNKQIVGQRDFVRPWNTEVFMDNQHGTNVLSLIAANEPGKLVSGAYDSDYILVLTEEVATEYRIEEFNWVRAAEYADSLGVDIINSSVGYWDFDDPAMNYTIEDLNGETGTITKGATIAAEKGILVVNSVGNYGSRGVSSLVAPADAKGIISIGSVTTAGGVSGFSSRGPTGDGRFKPELAAFGDNPVLIRSNGAVGSSNGTSFSAPQISALAAGLWEARPDWTKDELIEALIRSATQYESPDNLLGYGVPNFFDALYGEILAVEENENLDWKVYPNPLVENEISIRFGIGLKSSFELIEMTGRTLIQLELTRNDPKSPYKVQLEGIKPGLYLIQMREGALVKQTKLLRQ